MKSRFLAILEVVFIAAFLLSAFKLFTIYQDYSEGDAIYEESQSTFFEVDKGDDNDTTFTLNIDELKAVNKDSLGWIYIEDTPVNYPIMYTDNNDYYLKHTYDKRYSDFGSIFIDYRCQSDMSDKNTLIYGHNTKNGSMFGSLKKYKSSSYLNQHPYIYLIFDGVTYKYQIISAFTTEDTSYVYTLNFNGNRDFLSWLTKAMSECEAGNTGYTPTGEEKVITLSTCTSRTKTERFVVIATLAEKYENNGSAVIRGTK